MNITLSRGGGPCFGDHKIFFGDAFRRKRYFIENVEGIQTI